MLSRYDTQFSRYLDDTLGSGSFFRTGDPPWIMIILISLILMWVFWVSFRDYGKRCSNGER